MFRATALMSVLTKWYAAVVVGLLHEEPEPIEWKELQASNVCTLSKFHKIECEAVNVQHSQTNKPFHQKLQMSMFK